MLVGNFPFYYCWHDGIAAGVLSFFLALPADCSTAVQISDPLGEFFPWKIGMLNFLHTANNFTFFCDE